MIKGDESILRNSCFHKEQSKKCTCTAIFHSSLRERGFLFLPVILLPKRLPPMSRLWFPIQDPLTLSSSQVRKLVGRMVNYSRQSGIWAVWYENKGTRGVEATKKPSGRDQHPSRKEAVHPRSALLPFYWQYCGRTLSPPSHRAVCSSDERGVLERSDSQMKETTERNLPLVGVTPLPAPLSWQSLKSREDWISGTRT